MKTRLLDRIANGERPPRVPNVEQIRATTGPAADFDWGCQLPPASMAEIAALPDAEWETTTAPALSNPVALIQHAWWIAVAPLEALLAEPLPGTDWLAALRSVLPAAEPEPAPIPDGWDRPVTPEEHAAAAQRKATVQSWTAQAVGDPNNVPDYVARQQAEAARIFAGLETADESTPIAADAYQPLANPDRTRRRRSGKTYTAAQLDGTACAECGREFVEGEPARPVRDAQDRQVFVHSDKTQCEVAR